jgi:hypothetical protein
LKSSDLETIEICGHSLPHPIFYQPLKRARLCCPAGVKDEPLSEERLVSDHRLTEEHIFQSKKAEIGLKRLEKERFKQIAVDIKI